ncbi:PXA domain-containing protein [Peziza echinospora]|nr:PXA domain-containing protein [Peziza echinospora]
MRSSARAIGSYRAPRQSYADSPQGARPSSAPAESCRRAGRMRRDIPPRAHELLEHCETSRHCAPPLDIAAYNEYHAPPPVAIADSPTPPILFLRYNTAISSAHITLHIAYNLQQPNYSRPPLLGRPSFDAAPTLPPPPPATATAPPPPPPPPLPPQAIIEHQQTLALIRRILRPQSSPSTPLEDILPALTSSPQVDVQLYAFLAYICRDFIFAWYSKITNDRSFVDEVITVIAHTTRSLEQRTRQIDLEVLLLMNFLHSWTTTCECVARHKTCLSPHLTLEESFHNLQPHPALGSSPESEKLYLKVLASGLLAVLLPPEDLQSIRAMDALRNNYKTFGSTASDTTTTTTAINNTSFTGNLDAPTPITPLGDPLDVSHADVFYSGEEDFARKEAMIRKRRKSRKDSRASPLLLPRDREKAPGHHRRRSYAPSRQPPPLPPSEPTPPLHPILQKLDSTFALIFNLIMYATTALATLHIFLKAPHPAPRRQKPILRMAIFRFITTLTNIDKRQPWLTGNILLALSPITTRPAGSFVDTFISDQFQKAIVSQALNAKRTLLERIPEVVWRHYVSPSATDGKREAMVDEWLDLFASKSVNKHLVIQIVELLVGRLAPELAEERAGGVVEGLLGERGVKVG